MQTLKIAKKRHFVRQKTGDIDEKLRFVITGKVLRIFRSRCARSTVAFSASEALLGGFSYADYHRLVSRVREARQITNEIVILPNSEFFDTIGHLPPVTIRSANLQLSVA